MSTKADVWTVLTMLEWGTDYFSGKGITQPRLSIEWLLSHVLACKRLDLYLAFDRPLSQAELDELRALVRRRAQHEPLQYITGHTDFFNCRIDVNPAVLIPRPETEQLVEMVLDWGAERPQCRVLDVGTGSGCIAIAIKKAKPGWDVTGIDISPEALKTAAGNALINEADVRFSPGDLFDHTLAALHLTEQGQDQGHEMAKAQGNAHDQDEKQGRGRNAHDQDERQGQGRKAHDQDERQGQDLGHGLEPGYRQGRGHKFDIIVSNPPYITPEERGSLDAEVRDFEPSTALFHADILQLYTSLRVLAEKWLQPDGCVFVELSEFHTDNLFRIFCTPQWDASLLSDYSSKPRFIRAVPVR
jgi:methylase of polypeptide subunit release factors